MPPAITTRPALARLFDDASQFPPGNMELAPAWEAHQRWRASPEAELVGRFLVPARRAQALAALIEPGPALEIGIVTAGEQPGDLAPLLDGWVGVTSIELRGSGEEHSRWRERAPDSWLFFEGLPVDAVARRRDQDQRAGAKLRCGGLDADAFPSCERVASFIADCVRLDVPFKATAGLHAPLRHWDAEIGVFHHGFLNLWIATACAARGADKSELERCLEADRLDNLPAIGASELERARRWFTAFGTCSIIEPLEGLGALGLLDG